MNTDEDIIMEQSKYNLRVETESRELCEISSKIFKQVLKPTTVFSQLIR